MATGTFTWNVSCTKTLKEHLKTKKNFNPSKLNKRNVVGIGTTAIKPIFLNALWASFSLVRVVKCTAVPSFFLRWIVTDVQSFWNWTSLIT